MQPFQIYSFAFNWNNCTDERPWLLISQLADGRWRCFPLSTKCYSGNCFQLNDCHPAFPATMLTRTCFIHDEVTFFVPEQIIRSGRPRGFLTGDLLTQFREYAGL